MLWYRCCGQDFVEVLDWSELRRAWCGGNDEVEMVMRKCLCGNGKVWFRGDNVEKKV